MDFGPTSSNTVVDEFGRRQIQYLTSWGCGFWRPSGRVWSVRRQTDENNNVHANTAWRILCRGTLKSIQQPREDIGAGQEITAEETFIASPTVGIHDAVISHRVSSTQLACSRRIVAWAGHYATRGGGALKITEFQKNDNADGRKRYLTAAQYYSPNTLRFWIDMRMFASTVVMDWSRLTRALDPFNAAT